MLDYGESAVREGEISLGSNLGSLKQQAEAQINKLTGGGLLSSSQRTNYISSAKTISDALQTAAQRKQKTFQSQARINGVESAWNDFIAGSGFGGTADSNLSDEEAYKLYLQQAK